MSRATCAVGLMAHEEAGTVAAAIHALTAQDVRSADVRVIAVVSSGSADGTDAIVASMLAEDRRLRLLTEPTRCGKISAVNIFLESCPGMDLYVVTNADVALEPGALERLLAPFRDPAVGMTGGRIVPRLPANGRPTFLRFANQVLWDLHHRIALRRPKLGETVAFRPVVTRLPPEAVADEAYLEAMVHARDLRTVYVPEAGIRSACPGRLGEFFAVRRRNAAAHWMLRRRQGYEVATWPVLALLAALVAGAAAHCRAAYGRRQDVRAVAQLLRDSRSAVWLAALIVLECLARGLGILDGFLAPDRHIRWRIARSARVLASEASPVKDLLASRSRMA